MMCVRAFGNLGYNVNKLLFPIMANSDFKTPIAVRKFSCFSGLEIQINRDLDPTICQVILT
jgi:hypothetical protein